MESYFCLHFSFPLVLKLISVRMSGLLYPTSGQIPVPDIKKKAGLSGRKSGASSYYRYVSHNVCTISLFNFFSHLQPVSYSQPRPCVFNTLFVPYRTVFKELSAATPTAPCRDLNPEWADLMAETLTP